MKDGHGDRIGLIAFKHDPERSIRDRRCGLIRQNLRYAHAGDRGIQRRLGGVHGKTRADGDGGIREIPRSRGPEGIKANDGVLGDVPWFLRHAVRREIIRAAAHYAAHGADLRRDERTVW